MLIYGTVVESSETRPDGTMWVKLRIPSIHGAADVRAYRGSQERHNRIPDSKLPQYQCVRFSSPLALGEVVMLESTRNNKENWVVTNRMGSLLNSANIEGRS
jgi:hypothetical protein